MSHAELTAHRIYDTMHLDSVSEEVKRHLIILLLSKPEGEATNDVSQEELEAVAKRLSVNEEHFKEMKAHGFYRYQAPEQPAFVSEEQEIAYYDSMSEDDFLSEEETSKIMKAWQSL